MAADRRCRPKPALQLSTQSQSQARIEAGHESGLSASAHLQTLPCAAYSSTMRLCRFFALVILINGVGCSQVSSDQPHGPDDALAIAKRYAETHFPKGTFQPRGAPLEYFVDEAGASWKVELSPSGYLGGGLQVLVRKRDGKVVSALRTQ